MPIAAFRFIWRHGRAKKRQKDCQATLDHVKPLARGGADSEANTVAACVACNTAKGVMTAPMFRISAFLIARKAYAATVPVPPPPPKPVTHTVVVRKRPRPARS